MQAVECTSGTQQPRIVLHTCHVHRRLNGGRGGTHQTVEFDILCCGCSSRGSETPVHNACHHAGPSHAGAGAAGHTREGGRGQGERERARGRGGSDQSPPRDARSSGLHGLHGCVMWISDSVSKSCCVDHHVDRHSPATSSQPAAPLNQDLGLVERPVTEMKSMSPRGSW